MTDDSVSEGTLVSSLSKAAHGDLKKISLTESPNLIEVSDWDALLYHLSVFLRHPIGVVECRQLCT